MYTTQQNIIEKCTDLMQQGQLTSAQANVLMVRMEGVRIVSNSLPGSVRKALNDAVKTGELGHLKKEGMKPEVFFHPNSRSKAVGERNDAARRTIEALKKIAG